jgi:dUTP pyrophosphatase
MTLDLAHQSTQLPCVKFPEPKYQLNIKIDSPNPQVHSFYNEFVNHHQGDSGIDLVYFSDLTLGPFQIGTIDFGIKCEMISLETNTYSSYMLVPRSSIASTSFHMANSIGIIDGGYRGNIKAKVCNVSNETNTFPHGSYFQIIASDLKPVIVKVVDNLSTTTRADGGFGSTNDKKPLTLNTNDLNLLLTPVVSTMPSQPPPNWDLTRVWDQAKVWDWIKYKTTGSDTTGPDTTAQLIEWLEQFPPTNRIISLDLISMDDWVSILQDSSIVSVLTKGLVDIDTSNNPRNLYHWICQYSPPSIIQMVIDQVDWAMLAYPDTTGRPALYYICRYQTELSIIEYAIDTWNKHWMGLEGWYAINIICCYQNSQIIKWCINKWIRMGWKLQESEPEDRATRPQPYKLIHQLSTDQNLIDWVDELWYRTGLDMTISTDQVNQTDLKESVW